MRVPENIRPRKPVHRAIDVGQGDVQFASPALRAKKQRLAAALAKTALGTRRRFVPAQFLVRVVDAALFFIQTNPRD